MSNISKSLATLVLASTWAGALSSAALADSLVGAGQFGDSGAAAPAQGHTKAESKPKPASRHASAIPSKGSSFFKGAAAPLSGGVTVLDHVNPGAMRLKRATIPLEAAASSTGHGESAANSHELPLAGSIDDGSMKFQNLFPSMDSSNDPPQTLSGNAQQVKAVEPPKGHPIWQKSPLGGYYDASGSVREVIKGNQLYKYGGTMADGMTPAPSGPCEQNSMGYIKWQPLHGGPPGWY